MGTQKVLRTHATFASRLHHQLWGADNGECAEFLCSLMVAVSLSFTLSLAVSVSDLRMCSALWSDTNTYGIY